MNFFSPLLIGQIVFSPLLIVQAVLGIVSLVCFILVLIRMFQNGQTGLGIACIVLFFCFGIGWLIAFIVGWINAGRWGITNIMIVWTACWIIGIALNVIGVLAGRPPVVAPVR